MPVQKLNVVMLGGQGVGKSSLMAVLYNSLKTELQNGPLILNALGGTADRLEVLYNQLMEFGYTGEPSRGIQKTPDPAFYDFELASRSTTDLPGTPEDFSLHISFTDYPGEYIRENQIFVRDKINEASAVLIAIDTPALMEQPFLNERMNATNYFSALLQSVFSASRTPRLVLLTPIKCERWVQSLDGTRDLTERIRNGPYKDLLDNLAGMTTTAIDGITAKPYVAVAITPIQTVGSVVFFHFDKDEFGRPVHVWKKVSPDAPFAPVDCDQPLRYLMGFLIKQHLEHRRSPEHHFEAVGTAFAGRNVPGVVQGVLRAGAAIFGQVADHAAHLLGSERFWASWFGQLVDFFSGNEGFRKAVESFGIGAKRLPPFELLQGGYLIADGATTPALAEEQR
jgi:hypothetical protein